MTTGGEFLKKVFETEEELDILAGRINKLARHMADFISDKEHLIAADRLIIIRRKLAGILNIQYPTL